MTEREEVKQTDAEQKNVKQSKIRLPIRSKGAAFRRLEEDDPKLSKKKLVVSDQGTHYEFKRWGIRPIAQVYKDNGQVHHL